MVDAALLKQKIREGKTNELYEGLARIWDNEDPTKVLQVEGVYTETVFIEHDDEDDYLVWYFEAENMDYVAELWADPPESLREQMREAKAILERTLENPDAFDEGEFTPLHHMVNPERPSEVDWNRTE